MDPKDMPDAIMNHPKVLERRKVAAISYLSKHVTLDVAMQNELFPEFYDMLMFRMESEVLGEKLVEESRDFDATQFFPSSPWQFFKQRHADSWWLRRLVRRRPVRTEPCVRTLTVDFTRYANYPYATLELAPGLNQAVIWEQANGHFS